jgi:hypothetical protein
MKTLTLLLTLATLTSFAGEVVGPTTAFHRYQLISVPIRVLGASVDQPRLIKIDSETGRTWVYWEYVTGDKRISIWEEIKEYNLDTNSLAKPDLQLKK